MEIMPVDRWRSTGRASARLWKKYWTPGVDRMGNPTGSAHRMGKYLKSIIRNLRMPGASSNFKQRLSPFDKTRVGVEGQIKERAGNPLISNLRRKDE